MKPMLFMRKLIIITAPSGAGKTTIVHHLLRRFPELAFSVSATTRPRRAYEREGKDYYFISMEEFARLINQDAFVEWEEVYPGRYYGTLRGEVERLWRADRAIVFDIDVHGAESLKNAFPNESLAIFVKPPSYEALAERLSRRQTESAESLEIRLQRAKDELAYENKFDEILVNDNLEEALKNAEQIVRNYLATT